MTQRRAQCAGFTLIELLIAILVALGLVGVLTTLLTLVESGFDRSQALDEDVVKELQAVRILEYVIQNLQPPYVDSRERLVMLPNRFEFNSLSLQALRKQGTLRTQLAVEHRTGSVSLSIRQFGNSGDPKPVVQMTLLERLKDAYIVYHPRARSEVNDYSARVPAMITVVWTKLSAVDETRKFSVTPHLSVSARCTIDGLSSVCR